MARRNLQYEAQVQAQAQVAPQVYALQEALAQARADRNSAIHAAATAYKGVSGAIHRAGPQVRKNFRESQRMAAGTDAITAPALAGNPTIAAAAAHEGRVASHVLSRRLADRLSDLSDRRIAAAAGRAFQVGKAAADYSATAAGIQSKRQNLAAQEGLLAASNFSKLTESQADRDLRVRLQDDAQSFDAAKLASEQSFTAHQNALGRRADRIETGMELRGKRADRQFTAEQNALQRKNSRDIARINKRGSGGSSSGPQPTAATTFKGRQAIEAWKDQYAASGDMSKVASDARKKNVPAAIINAAANLHSKGYIAPREVQALERMGIAIPQEWKPQVIRPHLRKRRSRRK